MKKILILLMISLTLCSCGTKKETEENQNNTSTYSEQETKEETPTETTPVENTEKEEKTTSGYSNLKLINLEQAKKKILYEDTFILVVTQTNCGACISYKPVLNEVLKSKNILAYELDVRLLSEEDYEEALKYFGVDNTPTTIFYINGKEKKDYRLIGKTASSTIEKTIKELGYGE